MLSKIKEYLNNIQTKTEIERKNTEIQNFEKIILTAF